MTQFFDNAEWQNLPRDGHVMLYRDGGFAAPTGAARNFAYARWITVFANYRACGAVDLLEQPWYTRAMLRAFVRGRLALGKLARVYTDQAQAAEAVAALKDDGSGDLLADPGVVFWISTLDEIQHTPAELAELLADMWHAPEITPGRIWAEQWHRGLAGESDQSTLFQAW